LQCVAIVPRPVGALADIPPAYERSANVGDVI
jgi:hypothetical protein